MRVILQNYRELLFTRIRRKAEFDTNPYQSEHIFRSLRMGGGGHYPQKCNLRGHYPIVVSGGTLSAGGKKDLHKFKVDI